jgi:hypothetical protein
MPAIAAADLLEAWEQGQRLLLPSRALVVLAARGWGREALDRLSVGQRDALLIELRAQVFGSHVVSIADCPACSERLELAFDLRDISMPPPGDPTEAFELACEGYTLLARPPSAGDLEALDPVGGLDERRAALLRRCVLGARSGEQAIATEDLPAPVVAQLAAHLAAADPQADVQLALDCPACGHAWSALFDIVSFFWRELDAWARRTLRDVHTLAWAYGWREAEILGLSVERRAFYLELVRG